MLVALGRFVCLISARLSPALVVKSTFACLCLALVPLMLAHPCLALVHSISCLSCVHPVDAYLSLSGVHPFDVFSFLSSTCPVDVCPVPVSRSYSHSVTIQTSVRSCGLDRQRSSSFCLLRRLWVRCSALGLCSFSSLAQASASHSFR